MTQINLFMKHKQNCGHREQTGGFQRGGCWKRDGVGGWGQQIKLLYMEWLNNKILLYNTEKYTQYPMINHSGNEYKKNTKKNVYIYI